MQGPRGSVNSNITKQSSGTPFHPADKLTVSLIPVKALQMAFNTSWRHQAIIVILRGMQPASLRNCILSSSSPLLSSHHLQDELCEGIQMGLEYTVVGIPMYELSEGTSQAQISITVEVREQLK